MINRGILVIFGIVLVGCASTDIPGYVGWQQTYPVVRDGVMQGVADGETGQVCWRWPPQYPKFLCGEEGEFEIAFPGEPVVVDDQTVIERFQ